MRSLRLSFGTKEGQQRSTYADRQQQKQVKRASNKMGFNREANVRFHFACASVRKTPFTRSAAKMSRHFVADAHRGGGSALLCMPTKNSTRLLNSNVRC